AAVPADGRPVGARPVAAPAGRLASPWPRGSDRPLLRWAFPAPRPDASRRRAWLRPCAGRAGRCPGRNVGRYPWSSSSMQLPRCMPAREQQVCGDVLVLAFFQCALFATPSIATLLQRFVPGFGAEEGLAGLRELAFRGLQRLLRLRQPLLRGRDLATQPVDVRLAPGEHGCPVHARRRWI